MYTPAYAQAKDSAVAGELMRQYSFATLISPGDEAPEISHLPLHFEPSDSGGGILQGHMARANKHWCRFASQPQVLAIFHGAHTYISPRAYESKNQVPTWNYAVVHAHGQARVLDSNADKLATLRQASETYELALPASRGRQWRLEEQDPEFIDSLLGGIVAFVIEVERIDVKLKLSQNRSEADYNGVVNWLSASDAPADLDVASWMRRVGR